MNKVNLNLIAVLAIVAVISVPIAYALVESSIVINMVPSQTTDPFVVKDSFGVEVFAVEVDGTIVVEKIQFDDVNTRIDQVGQELIYNIATGQLHKFLVADVIQLTLDASNLNLFGNNLINAVIDGDLNTVLDISEDQLNVKEGTSGNVLTSNGVGLPPTYQAGGGGEVFTWTANHDASGFTLDNFGSLISNSVNPANAGAVRLGNTDQIAFRNTGNSDNHGLRTTGNDLSLFINNVNEYNFDAFGVDFLGNTLSNALIDCASNTCTNFPSGSQTPITQDIQYAGFDIKDISNVEFRQSTSPPANAVPSIFLNAVDHMVLNVDTNDDIIFTILGNQVIRLNPDGIQMGVNRDIAMGQTNEIVYGIGQIIGADSNSINFVVPSSDVFEWNIGAGLPEMQLGELRGIEMFTRFQYDKGSDLASASALTLGNANFFDITGTTTINTINPLSWVSGGVVILHFDSALTVTHDSGGVNDILFASNTNKVMVSGDVLTLIFSSPDWIEVSCTC